MYQTRHGGASIDRVRVFITPQEVQSTRSVAPLSPSSAPKQIENTHATCRDIVDKTTAGPAVRKRMIGKYLLDVFCGSDFSAKAANHRVLRGHVLEKPLALTRIRQDVSADNTLCALPKLFPPVLPSQTCFIVLACQGFGNTPAIRGCDVPKIQTLAAQLRTAWASVDLCIFGSPCRKRRLFLVGHLDSIARKCAWTGGCCSASGQNCPS